LGIPHVPGGSRVSPELTVRENLEMGAYLPSAKNTRQETMARVLDIFPLLRE